MVGLVGRPAIAQETSIQFASLDSVTADTVDTKTRFSLLSIESAYGGEEQSEQGGALCLVVSDGKSESVGDSPPDLSSPRTFCFYFQEDEPLRRDNDLGYDADRILADDFEGYGNRLNDWLGNAGINSPAGVADSIALKVAGAGEDEVVSVKDILGESSAERRKIQVDALSSNLALNLTSDGSALPDFMDFDGIMQAAHTLGAMMPRLRDAQRLPRFKRELEDSLEAKNKRIRSLRSTSLKSKALIWGVPVSIWWFIPGVFGLVFGGGLVLFVREWYVGERNEDQQKSQGPSPKTDESKPSPDSTWDDSGPEGDGEEESNGEVSRERIDRLERLIEDLKDKRQTVANEEQALSRETEALKQEIKNLMDIRGELSDLAERYERASKIDKKLGDRFRKKEDTYGKKTDQILGDLLDLYEAVCDTLGVGLISPSEAKKEVHNLDEAVNRLHASTTKIEGRKGKTLRERIDKVVEKMKGQGNKKLVDIIDEAAEKIIKTRSKIEEIGGWVESILGRREKRAENPVERFQDQLREVMKAASNGKQISTLRALRHKVEKLREDAARASELEEEVSSLEKDLNSVREDRDGLKQKLGDFEQKVESLEQKNDDIEECLDLMCDKISIDPINKSGDRWAEDFRRRLKEYTDNDWQALLGISASLLAFDKAKPSSENKDALLEELDFSELEDNLMLFSKKLKHTSIQKEIPNAFSEGWLHTLFRAKAVIDAYFQDEYPEVKDAIDQAESVMRTLLHRIDGDYHTISLPASLEEQTLPGGNPKTDSGSSILDFPGIKGKIEKIYEEEGGNVAYDVRSFPHRYDESVFKKATVYVASPSWLTS